ncbi:hypothetical protein SLEP1_g7131 [Rubroshorea leprosula]|uniref:Uncharacterized protein n=1 Tax=Rubroshorea leprosula TaxID=152421 RepID=A0AAV5I6M8_9ROSI|nr:hypothetical protein SLEP1_g7131 [Rubroshorea leprosula]
MLEHCFKGEHRSTFDGLQLMIGKMVFGKQTAFEVFRFSFCDSTSFSHFSIRYESSSSSLPTLP